MSNRNSGDRDPNTIDVEPGTLLMLVAVLLLAPLLLVGFFSH